MIDRSDDERFACPIVKNTLQRFRKSTHRASGQRQDEEEDDEFPHRIYNENSLVRASMYWWMNRSRLICRTKWSEATRTRTIIKIVCLCLDSSSVTFIKKMFEEEKLDNPSRRMNNVNARSPAVFIPARKHAVSKKNWRQWFSSTESYVWSLTLDDLQILHKRGSSQWMYARSNKSSRMLVHWMNEWMNEWTKNFICSDDADIRAGQIHSE